MKTEEIACPRCGSSNSSHIKKNGTTAQGKQRYRCKSCNRQFLFCLSYTYRAWNPLYRELIVPMTLNGSGIRDIARVLNISPTTVLRVLRQAAEQTPEPSVPARILALEVDVGAPWADGALYKTRSSNAGSGMNAGSGINAGFGMVLTAIQATFQLLSWGVAPMPVAESYVGSWRPARYEVSTLMIGKATLMIGKAMANCLIPNVTALAKRAPNALSAKISSSALNFRTQLPHSSQAIAAQNHLLFQNKGDA